MGCTEPIAIAYCSAKAARVLGCQPERIRVACSGNIVKNVMGVVVPNSGGKKGIDVAAVLGAVGGDPDRGLEVIASVSREKRDSVAELLKDKEYCRCEVLESADNLHIRICMEGGGHSSLGRNQRRPYPHRAHRKGWGSAFCSRNAHAERRCRNG